MARFFVDQSQITENQIYITGDDVKHISRVLRIRVGENIVVSDKNKYDYDCEISDITTDRVLVSIIKKYENVAEPNVFLTLYQGMPKSDKMDYIIQKCVEIGVVRIVPVITSRAVSRPSDSDKKILRWQKIAAEAAKQSGRGIVPEVCDVIAFKDALNRVNHKDELNIMPYECEREAKLRDCLIKNRDKTKINIFIGPEGGFDENEVRNARDSNVSTVSLGPRILRTETAPIAVCSAIMYELGDW